VTIQHNSPRRFNFNSNSGLVLAPNAAERLILPEGIGIEPKQLNDKPESIHTKPSEEEYSKVNGIYVPRRALTTEILTIVEAGSSDIRYGTQETRFSFEEVLHNSLKKIIKLEADNPWIKDIQEYFGRLEHLFEVHRRTDPGFTASDLISRSPLVMNRETFKKETYYPLKEFSLNSNSLEQLENIVLKSLKVEDDSESSPAKRFALRFLTNTVFIENFKSEKVNQAVIQALKTDTEPAAKKIYEHYLTTRLGDLRIEQKKEIIQILDKNNRLSSHLAQSLFVSEPSLKEGIETQEFPEVRNFEDLEKILTNLHAHSTVAMNQVDLLPSQINPDANYGIEIELKLAGKNGYRDGTSIIQKRLQPYADFIELGIDFRILDRSTGVLSNVEGLISELRTLSGGFKLNEENQRKLFEIVNIFHQSPDLMLFLSQHVHVDKESIPPPDLLLRFMQNEDFPTLETKSLDLDTMQLTANNNLIYSYQVSNLIDQMIVLEELKNTKPSIEAILKSFELNEKYGISLSIAQVMLTAVEHEKGYLIPNILRLNSQGKNYLETNYLLITAVDDGNEELAELILDKIAKNKLGEVLTQVDDEGRNALMIALDWDDTKLAKLILDKIPENKLGEVLTQVDHLGRNALMLALYRNDPELVKLILNKIPEDKLGEVLTQVDCFGRKALMLALKWENEELAELILNKIPEDKLGEV
jgi:hypothetical protein